MTRTALQAILVGAACATPLLGLPGVVAPRVAGAQTATPEAYEDRPIREIRVTTIAEDGGPGDALTGRDRQRVFNTIRSAVGSPYRSETVLDDVTLLNRPGVYRVVGEG